MATDMAGRDAQVFMPKITPEGGWNVNCAYGFQRCGANAADSLVRLEDVAVWLARTKPRKEVIYDLFVHFILDDGVRAVELYVLSAQSYAVPLVLDGRPALNAAHFWQYLPFTDRGASPEMLMRDIAEAWDDSWPGLSDPSVDDAWYIQRVLAANRKRGDLHKQGIEFDNRVSFDVEDRVNMMNRLRLLAVRHSVANELWGWGVAAESSQPADARGDDTAKPRANVVSLVPSERPEPAEPAEPVETHVSVPQRLQHPEWTGEKLAAKRKTLKGIDKTKQLSIAPAS
jgi:hypothetical protein